MGRRPSPPEPALQEGAGHSQSIHRPFPAPGSCAPLCKKIVLQCCFLTEAIWVQVAPPSWDADTLVRAGTQSGIPKWAWQATMVPLGSCTTLGLPTYTFVLASW